MTRVGQLLHDAGVPNGVFQVHFKLHSGHNFMLSDTGRVGHTWTS